MEKNEQIKNYKRSGKLDIQKAYNDFYHYVYTITIHIAKGRLKEEDVEEIISDTFLVLWKNQNKLEENKKIKPYIAGITKNLSQEKIRKNRTYFSITDFENTIESLDWIEEERKEIYLLKEIVNQLKEQDKEIFEQYYYEAKKIKEIAKELKLSEFTVKQRLYRIRKRIKKEISKKGGYKNEK